MCADYTTTHHEQPLSCVDHRGRQRRACTCARTRAAWATLAMHLSPRRRAVYGASCNPVRPRTRGLGAGSDVFLSIRMRTRILICFWSSWVCAPLLRMPTKSWPDLEHVSHMDAALPCVRGDGYVYGRPPNNPYM